MTTEQEQPCHHRAALREKVHGKPCRVCGGWYNIQGHHIVHRSRIGGKHPHAHCPDNLMPVCHDCHQNHHTTAHRRIPRKLLEPTELAFAVQHSTRSWVERWYPDPEPLP